MADKTSFQFYCSVEREEEYLNRMIDEGFVIRSISFGFIYRFDKCEPGEYICRTTFVNREDKDTTDCDKSQKDAMLEILTESGAEIVQLKATTTKCIIYAVRKKSFGEFEINTDITSTIAEYKRRLSFHLCYAALFLALGSIVTALTILNVCGNDALAATFGSAGVVLIFCSLAFAIPAIRYSRIIKQLQSNNSVSE